MMTISDETLSAFLDAELSDSEMENVRQRISEDETLVNRLAELAMVDEQVAQHYRAIDSRPMPDNITQLLGSTSVAPATTATVIAFPLWKKIAQGLQQHSAIAACTLLVLGFGLTQLLPNSDKALLGNWNAIATTLDTTASGTEQQLADGKRIKPRLTFINNDGNYCRQFMVTNARASAESIACRANNKWQPKVTVYSQGNYRSDEYQSGEYQTATNNAALLDSTLDELMNGDPFDAQQESEIMRNNWNRK